MPYPSVPQRFAAKSNTRLSESVMKICAQKPTVGRCFVRKDSSYTARGEKVITSATHSFFPDKNYRLCCCNQPNASPRVTGCATRPPRMHHPSNKCQTNSLIGRMIYLSLQVNEDIATCPGRYLDPSYGRFVRLAHQVSIIKGNLTKQTQVSHEVRLAVIVRLAEEKPQWRHTHNTVTKCCLRGKPIASCV